MTGLSDNYVHEQVKNEWWKAIIHNDAFYNDKFFYGVKTTKIFCKPSCKSRAPKKENVLIFENAEHALQAKFRPCKRCKPTNERLPDSEWVALISEYIEKNFAKKITLEILADNCHGSPYHLQRTFKRIKGITPVEYLQQIRLKAAKDYLLHTNKRIADISIIVGFHNIPYFITLFKNRFGHTPAQYRKLNR